MAAISKQIELSAARLMIGPNNCLLTETRSHDTSCLKETVRRSFAELATLAVQLLLEILGRKKPAQTQIVIEPTLIVRQSTTRPRQEQAV